MFGISLQALFRRDDGQGDSGHALPSFVDAAIDRLIRLTNPRLRLLDGHRAYLAAAAEAACTYARGVAQMLPAPLDVEPSAWARSDHLRAFFVGADEIDHAYGSAPELQRLFRRNLSADAAYCMLAMRLVEQKVLGMALEDGMLRRDVAQTTMSFSGHRVRVCATSEAEFLDGVAWQVIDHLGVRALARMTQIEDRRHELQIDRALLEARLRMLKRQENRDSSLDGSEPSNGDMARLEEELQANARDLSAVGGGTAGLELALGILRDVLASPADFVRCVPRRVCLSPVNVVLDTPGDQPFNDITFIEAHVDADPPITVALMPTRFPRKAFPAQMPTLAQRGRTLL